MHNVPEIKTQLREAFPGWSIITSDRGRWWATRGPLPDDRLHEVAALDADSPEQLAARLRQVVPARRDVHADESSVEAP